MRLEGTSSAETFHLIGDFWPRAERRVARVEAHHQASAAAPLSARDPAARESDAATIAILGTGVQARSHAHR